MVNENTEIRLKQRLSTLIAEQSIRLGRFEVESGLKFYRTKSEKRNATPGFLKQGMPCDLQKHGGGI